MLKDLAHEATLLPGRALSSIFFGGGTPSLMPPETAAALIDAAAQHWSFTDDIEITLEANPNSAEAARFADLAAAGVNRVSLGLQSLDETALTLLGRAHGVAEGLAALEAAQRLFPRVSFDLIHTLPGQSLAAWEQELRRALSFGTEHLSLYQLTIEPGTRFATEVAQGRMAVVDPDLGADFYELTSAITAAAGLPAYEISNHARPGRESRHNLAYWRYRDYAGIGPGAHGRRGGLATVRHKKPENWINAITRNGSGVQEEAPLSPRESAREAMVMGLRLAEGLPLDALANRFGLSVAALIDEDRTALLQRHGLLLRTDDHLTLTPEGRLVLDRILAEIVLA